MHKMAFCKKTDLFFEDKESQRIYVVWAEASVWVVSAD